MSKSSWKPKYIHKSIFKLIHRKGKKRQVWSRASVIPSFLVGSSVRIHTGNRFVNIIITPEKVGYKFGEFVFTRKRFIPKKKDQKIKAKK